EVRQRRPPPVRGQGGEKVPRQDEIERFEWRERIGLAEIDPREADACPEGLRDDFAVSLRKVALQDLRWKGGGARARIRGPARARDRPRAQVHADHLELERGSARLGEGDRQRVGFLARSARGAQAPKWARLRVRV